MPWKEGGPMLERTRFIDDYLSGFFTITELARRYGVSRRTLHKWLARHDVDGLNGLADRSRAPRRSPQRIREDLVAQIVTFRKRFPFMGPRKIVVRLTELHPEIDWPAASTVGDILARADLVAHRRRRNPPAHPLRARTTPLEPNDLMTIDYKGQFLLRNHRYCYPLTIVDHVTRFILACDAFHSTQQVHTRHAFERVFRIVRSAPSNSLGQRQSLRLTWLGKAIESVALVDPSRDRRRTHRSRSSRTERRS